MGKGLFWIWVLHEPDINVDVDDTCKCDVKLFEWRRRDPDVK